MSYGEFCTYCEIKHLPKPSFGVWLYLMTFHAKEFV